MVVLQPEVRIHWCKQCGEYRPVSDDNVCTPCLQTVQVEVVERPPVEYEIPMSPQLTEEQKQAVLAKFVEEYGDFDKLRLDKE